MPGLRLSADLAPATADLTETLAAGVRPVLLHAVRGGGLTLLELRAVGSPGLAIVARGSRQDIAHLALWTATTPPCSWHAGLLMVACAPDDGVHRRQVVTDALELVHELVVADRRRVQAESLANRALTLAGVDSLTQLGNRRTWRRAIEEESARAVRYGRETAVAVIDLDGLKAVNDADGHAVGDALLTTTAQAVRAASRSLDVVCRLGGDEFGVLAPEAGGEGVRRLADRLLHALQQCGVEASIGVASTATGDLDAAWREADRLMYQQKRQRTASSRSVDA